MRAPRFYQFGLENLRVEDVPTPRPRDHEVLVKVHAASINPIDIKTVQGMMGNAVMPRTPGHDFAGVIEAGPANCMAQEVWGSGGDMGFTRDGAHAEYVTVPADAVVPKPKNLSFEQTASMALNLVTAWAAIFDRAELKKGETLLVMGANGGVGHAAAELGGWAGARVIGVDRDAKNTSRADVMLSSSAPSFPEDLKKIAGEGVQVVLDTVSGPMFEVGINALGYSGRMVVITVAREQRVSLDLLRFYRDDLRLFGLNTLHMDTVASAMILKEIVRPIELAWLTPRELEIHPLSDAPRAYEQAARGGKKHVLSMVKS